MAERCIGRTKKGSTTERVRQHLAEHPAAILTCADHVAFDVAPQTWRNVLTRLIRAKVLRSDNTRRPARYQLASATAQPIPKTRDRIRDWLDARGGRTIRAKDCAAECRINSRTIERMFSELLALGVLERVSRGSYRIVKALPQTSGVSDNGVSLQAVWHAVATPKEDTPWQTPAPSRSPPPSH